MIILIFQKCEQHKKDSAAHHINIGDIKNREINQGNIDKVNDKSSEQPVNKVSESSRKHEKRNQNQRKVIFGFGDFYIKV